MVRSSPWLLLYQEWRKKMASLILVNLLNSIDISRALTALINVRAVFHSLLCMRI
jgi:hypothetical protein